MRKATLLLTLLCCLNASSQTTESDVLSVARKVNDYFMAHYADPTLPTNVKKVRPSSLWTRAVYYEGLMSLNAIDSDKRYTDYALRWADFHQWTPRNGINTCDADDQCCIQTYLQLLPYTTRNRDELTRPSRDNLLHQMQTPNPKVGDALYGWWTWIDGKDCYWSRGNGWVYVALIRCMDELQPNDKFYKELKKDFLLMSKGLLKCQREDGFWNPSLVSSNYAMKETSGTALFVAGMAWGIRHGLLKAKTYRPVIDKAWEAMVRDAVHHNGFLGWMQGTGKDPSAGQPLSYTKIPDFEDYGTGCFLLGAVEYYRLLKGDK